MKSRSTFKQILPEEKQAKILDQFKEQANNKVNMQLNLQKAQGLAKRIQAGFEKDEQVQVSENFLDKKNQQELIDLMNALFQERASALRKFVYALMDQKQAELQDIKDEYEPLKEVLRQRKAGGGTQGQHLAEFTALQRGLPNRLETRRSGHQPPVHRRLRVKQKSHHILELLLGQDAGGAKTRHVGAHVVGMGVPKFGPGVLEHGLALPSGTVTGQ